MSKKELAEQILRQGPVWIRVDTNNPNIEFGIPAAWLNKGEVSFCFGPQELGTQIAVHDIWDYGIAGWLGAIPIVVSWECVTAITDVRGNECSYVSYPLQGTKGRSEPAPTKSKPFLAYSNKHPRSSRPRGCLRLV